MAEKDQILKEQLDHSGIFDFSAFYRFAHTWFKDRNYGVVEEKYGEKVSDKGREIKIEWKATKNISDYFKIEHDIKFEIKGLVDVEVEVEKKKKKMNRGSIWMEVKGILIKDPESNWDVSPFMRFLRDVYNKYIVPARVDASEDKVRDDAREFRDEMKAFLELTGKR